MTPTIPTDLIDRLEKSQPALRHMITNWRRGGAAVRQIEKTIAQTACRTGRGMTPQECVSMAAVADAEIYRTCEDKIAEYDTLPRFVREARTETEASAFMDLWRSGTVNFDGSIVR
jgi:hypothetical protein